MTDKAKCARHAEELVAAGYKQTSNKYRMVAKLPDGKTGYEALRDADPQLAARFLENFQRSCTDQFLRVYASDKHKKTLDELTFTAFRAAGGGPPR